MFYISDPISVFLCHNVPHRAHEGFLDQGIMVKDAKLLRENYRKSGRLKFDILSILPTDLAYLLLDTTCHERIPCSVILRINRLLRIDRMFEFFDKTESRTTFPNAFR